MQKCLFTFVLVLALPLVALAQPLADRVPGDAVLYVGWRGTGDLGPQYSASHLKAVLDQSNLAEVFTVLLPQVVDKISAQGGDPAARQALQALASIGPALWQYPSAVAMQPLTWAGDQPQPHFLVLCQAGKDADDLVAKVQKLIPPGAPPGAITVSQTGGLVTFAISVGPAPAPAAGAPKSLAEVKEFQQALAQVQKDPVVVAYVDGAKLLAMIDDAMAHAPMQPRAKWPAIRDGLGLAGLQRLIFTGGFDGPNWSTQAFIQAPTPRTGLLALLGPAPLSADALAAVPQTAALAGGGRLDLANVLTQIRASLGAVDPMLQQQYDMVMQQVRQVTGMDLQLELFTALGDQWVYYSDQNVGGTGMLGVVVVNRLRDPAKAEAALGKLADALNNLIAAQMNNPEMTVSFRQTKAGDLTIHYLAIPAVAPAWAVKDGNLYVALYPQMVAGAAGFVAGKGKALAANPQFAALRAQLKAPEGAAFQYLDLPQTIGEGYQSTLLVSRLYLGFADMMGLSSPPMALPPLDKLRPHVAPAGSFSWADDTGWHMRGTSPFPGAEVLASSQNAMLSTQAMALGVMLPALGAARQSARSMQGMSQLRQIAMGVMMHANDHQGAYPADLGALVSGGYLDQPQILVDPQAGVPIPADFAGWAKDKQAAWVNQNASYVYLGKGKTDKDTGAEFILAHQKPQFANRGNIGVAFGDGHVEMVPVAAALQWVKAQEAAGKAVPRPGGAPGAAPGF